MCEFGKKLVIINDLELNYFTCIDLINLLICKVLNLSDQ